MEYIKIGKNIDYDKFLKLYQDANWTNYTDNFEMLKKALDNSLAIFVAKNDDEIVGHIRVVGDGSSIIYIQDIIVLNKYQRLGIGTRLLKMVLEEYKEVYQTVLLTLNEEKTNAFYTSLGFVNVKEYDCNSYIIQR